MKEKFYIWLAWVLPRELVKWCYIRVAASSTFHKDNSDKTPSDISIMDALQQW